MISQSRINREIERIKNKKLSDGMNQRNLTSSEIQYQTKEDLHNFINNEYRSLVTNSQRKNKYFDHYSYHLNELLDLDGLYNREREDYEQIEKQKARAKSMIHEIKTSLEIENQAKPRSTSKKLYRNINTPGINDVKHSQKHTIRLEEEKSNGSFGDSDRRNNFVVNKTQTDNSDVNYTENEFDRNF